MCDNYFQNCPPKMGGFRELTNYQTDAFINEQIKQNLNIVRDDQYRVFLQNNGQQILDNTWDFYKNNYSCWNNQCIFRNKRTIIPPTVFPEEMKRWNGLTDNSNIYIYPCELSPDYRLNSYGVSCVNKKTNCNEKNKTCNCCKCDLQQNFVTPAPILKNNLNQIV